MKQLRIALAQINSTVGDFEGNVRLIIKNIDRARNAGTDVVAFPEMAIPGYPPEDLLLKSSFIDANLRALDEVVAASKGITVVVGFVDKEEELHNSAAIIHDGELVSVYHKIYLPNYGVFDEKRYFHPGDSCPVYEINGVNVGISVCEDIWYDTGPATVQASGGAEVILNISASPYHHGKHHSRERMLGSRATDNVAIVAFCNLVGGQDELVFDGGSVIFDEQGNLISRAKQFEEELLIADLDVEGVFHSRLQDPRWRKEGQKLECDCPTDRITVSASRQDSLRAMLPKQVTPLLESDAEVYKALVLGTRDYILKNGFGGVIIGLSGGVDSSLVATIAVDALGPESVHGLIMPSRFSSPLSAEYANKLATNLGIKAFTVPIEMAYSAYLDSLSEVLCNTKPDVTEENLQARIRGTLLMALSNKFGWMVLNTGNKSEVATGYTTLYGDMAGGYAIIKDVPKTLVNRLCRYRNTQAGFDLIPEAVINRIPSAELRPGQKDTDTLPEYDLLDPILLAYVEEDKGVEQIIAQGYEPSVVKKVVRLVDTSEYKRRQSPPGIKITPKAFGRDRREPITSKFREGG
ncbi:NAD+ synthase [Dehalogenimonas etheniformans]|uniref:Glutamine-dependent NAD(+) synthetase n=1 Tax=Dehalogenimonas etheniformans TaxID=1536648 RepID=A0A2P5P947_9CHLR|nr:NAD+ synthase [Dehalogenimonas etheniformans]PPD58814.1 NAD+ synthase [Dehalogenimonas etheniformans]QNT76417.1 NAD+ synthase [Dehalogenimonas etheniformans]